MNTTLPKHPFKLLSQAGYHGNQLEVLQKLLRLSSRKFTRAKIRQQTLADYCGLSVKGLQKILVKLKADGVVQYPEKGGKVKEYALNFEKLIELAEQADPRFKDFEEMVTATELPKQPIQKPEKRSEQESSNGDLGQLRSSGWRIIEPTNKVRSSQVTEFVTPTNKVPNSHPTEFVTPTNGVRIFEPEKSSHETENNQANEFETNQTKGFKKGFTKGLTKGLTAHFVEEHEMVSSPLCSQSQNQPPSEIPSVAFDPASLLGKMLSALQGNTDVLSVGVREFPITFPATPSVDAADELMAALHS
jgi:hypothetical protein